MIADAYRRNRSVNWIAMEFSVTYSAIYGALARTGTPQRISGSSRLRIEEVREIKRLLRDHPGIPVAVLASKFRKTTAAIYSIRRGKSYRGVLLED